MELIERIKQIKAERWRYFDVKGDGVDVLLNDVWNYLEARPTADLGEELIAMIVKWEDSIETPDDLARKIIERVSRSGG